MWAAGGLGRQIPADATASQFGKAGATTLPLLPGDGAQPPPDPLIECAQHRRGLAEAEISAPADKVSGNSLAICSRLHPHVRRVSCKRRSQATALRA